MSSNIKESAVDDSGPSCIVCYEDGAGPLHNPCSRCSQLRLHDECLQKWLSRSNSCPTCRMPLMEEDGDGEEALPSSRADASGAGWAGRIFSGLPEVHEHVLSGIHGFQGDDSDMMIGVDVGDALPTLVMPTRQNVQDNDRTARPSPPDVSVLLRAVHSAQVGRRRGLGRSIHVTTIPRASVAVRGGRGSRPSQSLRRRRGNAAVSKMFTWAALLAIFVMAMASAYPNFSSMYRSVVQRIHHLLRT